MTGRVMVSFNWLDSGSLGVRGEWERAVHTSDTIHRLYPSVHSHTHTRLHSAMRSWQLRLILYRLALLGISNSIITGQKKERLMPHSFDSRRCNWISSRQIDNKTTTYVYFPLFVV